VGAVLRVHNALCEQIDAALTKFCDEVPRRRGISLETNIAGSV
jgi:hypothetical protein